MYKKIVTAIALAPIFVVISGNLTFNSFDLPNNLSNTPTNTQTNIISNLLIPPVEAVQLRDGKTYFLQLPIFLDAEATVNSINARSVTYYFAIALPKNMGEPLQKLEFFQTEGFESVDFTHNDTIAYLQKPSGDRVSISSKTELLSNQDQSNQARKKITVTFDPPILASNELNSKLIVGLRPIRNPRYEGVYLFGVAASPKGDRPNSQFLGYGRLNFYSWRY